MTVRPGETHYISQDEIVITRDLACCDERDRAISALIVACQALCDSVELMGITRCIHDVDWDEVTLDQEYVDANWEDFVPICELDAYHAGKAAILKTKGLIDVHT